MVTGIGSVNGAQKMGTTAMGQLNGIPHTQSSPAPEPAKKPSDIRRSNKPIMEKRRRARINNCLNELKTLILDAMKKDPARHSKLEKADILEMTVKHLENLQRQQFVMSQATDPNVMNKFKSGFSECMNEVGRFPGIDPQLKRRLLQHLNNVINGVKTEPHHHPANVPVQVHILPSPPSSPKQDANQPQTTQITATSNGYFLTSNTGAAVQLIPTKLTNGNIAFVLPQQLPSAATPVPMLVPIPTRTSSTGSAVSSSRDHVTSPYHTPPSPANSYEAMDCKPNFQQLYQQQHMQQQLQPPTFQQVPMPQPHHHVPQPHHQRAFSPSTPLSLVMRKSCDADMQVDDDKPWRPW